MKIPAKIFNKSMKRYKQNIDSKKRKKIIKNNECINKMIHIKEIIQVYMKIKGNKSV